MAHIIEVKDRIPTYAGRVTMTPVVGQENTYDMVRADMPLEEGTPINKALFDQKANRLTEDITVYVSTNGSDTDGSGTSASPYATVQKALNDIPKYLDGHHAQIDIANGDYDERVTVDGFSGGRLTIGVSGRTVNMRGISVLSSSVVRVNVSDLSYSARHGGPLLQADYGSNVSISSALNLRGENASVSGIMSTRGSQINAAGVSVVFTNFGSAAVLATAGATIALGSVEGSGNSGEGLKAESGAVISYGTKNLSATGGDVKESGGRIHSSEDKVGSADIANSAVTATKIAANAVSKSFTVTLTAGGWNNNSQTVNATGVTASNTVIVSPAAASFVVYGEAQIRCTAQAANSLTFMCEGAPEEAVTVNVTCINK